MPNLRNLFLLFYPYRHIIFWLRWLERLLGLEWRFNSSGSISIRVKKLGSTIRLRDVRWNLLFFSWSSGQISNERSRRIIFKTRELVAKNIYSLRHCFDKSVFIFVWSTEPLDLPVRVLALAVTYRIWIIFSSWFQLCLHNYGSIFLLW